MISSTSNTYYIILLNGKPMAYNILFAPEEGDKISLTTVKEEPIWKTPNVEIARAAIKEPLTQWADSSYNKPFIPKQYLDKGLSIGRIDSTTVIQELPEQVEEEMSF